jgi:hypothetical protein
VKHASNVRRLLGHVLFEDEVGMGLVPEQLCPFDPERDNQGERFLIVEFVVMIAASHIASVDLLSQGTPLGVL